MAYRGRGRGRGGSYGGGFRYSKPEPTILFPETKLPDKSFMTKVPIPGQPDKFVYETKEKMLVKRNYRFQNFWKASPYFLEDTSKKCQSKDIETYSGRVKRKNIPERDTLDSFMTCNSFPPELHDVLIGKKGLKRQAGKKVRWNPDSDLQKLDLFEKLEEQANPMDGMKDEEEEDETGKNKKKDGGNEDENEDGVEEEKEDSEYSTDGDYNQNEHFDDDEDDLNMEDDGDDEPVY